MKFKLLVITLLAMISLVGCDSDLELLQTDNIQCEVTRVYRDNGRDVNGFYIDVFDTDFNENVTLNINSKEYGQILVGNVLSIERKKLYDKGNNVYRYRYALTYEKMPENEDIESETVEYVYVTIIDKYTTVHRSGKTSSTHYHLVYEDTETNKLNTERIDMESYNIVKIGESYKAFRTKVTNKEGNTYYKYELLRKSKLN